MKKNADFEKLSKQYFDEQIRRSPIAASFIGIHDYDHELDDLSPEMVDQERKTEEEYLKKFEAFEDSTLSDDQKIDKKLFVYTTGLSAFFRDVLKKQDSYVDVAQTLSASVFVLFSREFAPLEDRVKSIVSRLNLFENRIEQFKKRIKKPVKLWIEMAVRNCSNTVSLVDTIVSSAKGNVSDNLYHDLEKAAVKAKDALAGYRSHIEGLLTSATEEFWMTPEQYEVMVGKRCLGLTVDEILEIGYKSAKETREKMLAAADRIERGASIERAREIIAQNCPKEFEKALELYRETIQACQDFVVRDKFADDSGTKLEVVITPEYMRPLLPIAAYQGPSKFDKDPVGKYLVTPPADPKFLSYFPIAHIKNVSIHEGYPGHHLQISTANHNKSWMRVFAHAIEFIEGWALYCEEETYNMGFERTADRYFRMLSDLYWRSWRIIIDIKLCTGKMTFDEAVQTLVKEVGMPENVAVSEIERYTESPGYQFSYLIGKHMMLQLKEDYKNLMGKDFTNYEFHNRLLKEGNLPIFLHREILMNQKTAQA